MSERLDAKTRQIHFYQKWDIFYGIPISWKKYYILVENSENRFIISKADI